MAPEVPPSAHRWTNQGLVVRCKEMTVKCSRRT